MKSASGGCKKRRKPHQFFAAANRILILSCQDNNIKIILSIKYWSLLAKIIISIEYWSLLAKMIISR